MFEPQSIGMLLVLLGVGLSCSGSLYRIPVIGQWDIQVSRFLHLKLNRYLVLFRMLWPFGKSPLTVVLLILLFFSDWTSGGWALGFYVLISCIERALKLTLKRQRPFSLLADVGMYQPRSPHDPSHPSGDVLRVWYLTVVLPVAFALSWPLVLLFVCIALLVSLGRIAFGVHFLLDIVGGAGLGLFGAGLYCLSF